MNEYENAKLSKSKNPGMDGPVRFKYTGQV